MVNVKVHDDNKVNVSVNNPKVSVSTRAVIAEINVPSYDGSYLVIPSSEQQELQTSEKRCTENIIVAPIPNNYGLITWNGAYLTVS